MNPKTLERVMTAFHFLSAYHKYEVVGIERVPRQGAAVIIINHSLATYDSFLLAGAIYQHTGRICRSLGDKKIFENPLLSKFATSLGMVEGSQSTGLKLLKDGHLLIVSPGGMRESLRPKKNKYQILWHDRLGFARLACSANAPIILAACPAADDVYSVYENPLTRFVYERFKFPLPIARGLGLSILPKPVPLKHYVRQPIDPPQKMNGNFTRFHSKVVEEMEKLMAFGEHPISRPKNKRLLCPDKLP